MQQTKFILVLCGNLCFSSIDRPWVAQEGGDYLLPESGIGPVTYDHARPIMVRNPNIAGVAQEIPLRVADLNTHVFKPSECQTAYQKLLHDRASTMGCHFDWS